MRHHAIKQMTLVLFNSRCELFVITTRIKQGRRFLCKHCVTFVKDLGILYQRQIFSVSPRNDIKLKFYTEKRTFSAIVRNSWQRWKTFFLLEFQGPGSPVLRQVVAPVVTKEECSRLNEIPNLSDSLLCVGLPFGGASTCSVCDHPFLIHSGHSFAHGLCA